MQYIKLFALAALTILAAMAYVGASTASAVVLCEEEKEHKAECPKNKIYAVGDVEGVSSEAEIYDEELQSMMSCESIFLGLVETRTEKYQPILIENTFVFFNCEGGKSCESVETNVPIMLAFEKGTLNAWFYKDTEFNPEMNKVPHILMKNCYEAGLDCLYQEEELSLTYNKDELIANPAYLHRISSPLFCPEEIFLVATYEILADLQNPYPLYVTHKP